MQTIKEMIQQIQAITYDAYKSSGQVAALLGEPSSPPEAMVKALEQTAAGMEQGTVELRALCESCLPELLTIGRKPVLPPLDVAGSISVNEFGWLLASLGLLAFSRNDEYFMPTPEGYQFLSAHDLPYQPPSKRPYAKSPILRRRLEVGSILFTCLGAGIEPALDKVERFKHQPVFLPALTLRSGDGNLMNAAGCAGFGHWGDTAYMVQYVGENSPGFFMNNELAHLHNLASVFSERLDTPQTLLLVGESYRSVYTVLSRATPTQRNGKKGFVDYSQAYPQLGIPACLLSCDDTGALQLAIMRQMDYRAKIAQAAFGARWMPEDDRIPEADGQVDGKPLVIAVDMDLRRLDRVCRDARQQGRKEILVAALDGQMSGLLLEHFPKEAPVRPLRVNHKVLSVAFGGECALGDPWPDAPLNWQGGLVHV